MSRMFWKIQGLLAPEGGGRLVRYERSHSCAKIQFQIDQVDILPQNAASTSEDTD